MIDAEEENWRDREESLEFAVLETATDGRARNVSLCMKREKRVIDNAEGAIYEIGLG